VVPPVELELEEEEEDEAWHGIATDTEGLTRFSTEEFLDLAITAIRSKDVAEDRAEEGVLQAARDLFGSWQRGIKAALEELMERYTERVGGKVLRGDLPGAREALEEIRSYVEAVAAAGILDPGGGSGRSSSRGKGLLRLLETKIGALESSVNRLEAELRHLRTFVGEKAVPLDEMNWAARNYHLSQDFAVGELLYHPGFGIGIVTEIDTQRRITVVFSKGKVKKRVLVMNHRR
jgi:hypothetical protein